MGLVDRLRTGYQKGAAESKQKREQKEQDKLIEARIQESARKIDAEQNPSRLGTALGRISESSAAEGVRKTASAARKAGGQITVAGGAVLAGMGTGEPERRKSNRRTGKSGELRTGAAPSFSPPQFNLPTFGAKQSGGGMGDIPDFSPPSFEFSDPFAKKKPRQKRNRR